MTKRHQLTAGFVVCTVLIGVLGGIQLLDRTVAARQ